jgi:hypothetical protein
MTPSEQFLKFAADCESMARFTPDPESRPVWHRMAERWVRCAQVAERENLAALEAQRQKRNQERQRRRDHSERDYLE